MAYVSSYSKKGAMGLEFGPTVNMMVKKRKDGILCRISINVNIWNLSKGHV